MEVIALAVLTLGFLVVIVWILYSFISILRFQIEFRQLKQAIEQRKPVVLSGLQLEELPNAESQRYGKVRYDAEVELYTYLKKLRFSDDAYISWAATVVHLAILDSVSSRVGIGESNGNGSGNGHGLRRASQHSFLQEPPLWNSRELTTALKRLIKDFQQAATIKDRQLVYANVTDLSWMAILDRDPATINWEEKDKAANSGTILQLFDGCKRALLTGDTLRAYLMIRPLTRKDKLGELAPRTFLVPLLHLVRRVAIVVDPVLPVSPGFNLAETYTKNLAALIEQIVNSLKENDYNNVVDLIVRDHVQIQNWLTSNLVFPSSVERTQPLSPVPEN